MLEPGAAVGPTDTASGWLGLRVGIDVGGTMCKICYLETPQREVRAAPCYVQNVKSTRCPPSTSEFGLDWSI